MTISGEFFRSYWFWGAVALVAFIAVSAVRNNRRPKEKSFICAKCKKEEAHTPRTIQEWRSGQRTFYCWVCYNEWMRSKNPNYRPKKGGCTPVILIGFFIAGAITYVKRHV